MKTVRLILRNSEKFVFKGSASDNDMDTLYINGDEVLFYDSTASKGEKETNKRESKRSQFI